MSSNENDRLLATTSRCLYDGGMPKSKPRMSMSWPFPLNLVPAPGRPGLAVPQHFTATVELDDLTVHLGWHVEDGDIVLSKVSAEGVVTEDSLKLDEWTAKALDGAAAWVRDRVRQGGPAAPFTEPVDEVPVGDERIWNNLTDEHLAEVADVFKSADEEGVFAVAKRFKITHSTARGRIATARKRGILV